MKLGFIENFALLSLILILRYFLGAGAFYLYAGRKSGNIVLKHDIKWSVLSSVVFGFFGAITIRLWELNLTKIYFNWNEYSLLYFPLSLILYVSLHDTYFYWTHRLLHKSFFLKNIHFAHHLSRKPTAFTSFSFHPAEAVVQAVFLPILLMIIPIHISMLIVYLTIMSVFGITNHLGLEIYPVWLEKRLFLITANHHQKHHDHFDKNFGLYFSFWDRWMNTEKGHQ